MMDPRKDVELIDQDVAQLFERLRNPSGIDFHPNGYVESVRDRIDKQQNRFAKTLELPEDLQKDWGSASFDTIPEYSPGEEELKARAKAFLISDLESTGAGLVSEYSVQVQLGLVEICFKTNLSYISGEVDSIFHDALYSEELANKSPVYPKSMVNEEAQKSEGRYGKNVRLSETDKTLRCSIAGGDRLGTYDLRICLGRYAFFADLLGDSKDSIMVRHEKHFSRRSPTPFDITLTRQVCERILNWAENIEV